MKTKPMKHTPGPWKVDVWHTPEGEKRILAPNGQGIAILVNANGRDNEETEANAALIAAAPEMYDWLVKEYALCAPLSSKGRELAKLIAKAQSHTKD